MDTTTESDTSFDIINFIKNADIEVIKCIKAAAGARLVECINDMKQKIRSGNVNDHVTYSDYYLSDTDSVEYGELLADLEQLKMQDISKGVKTLMISLTHGRLLKDLLSTHLKISRV